MSLPPPELHPLEAAVLAARTAARAADEEIAEVAYATVDSPVGRLVAVSTPRGLARLAYELENGGLDEILDDVALRLSPAIVEAPGRLDAIRRELDGPLSREGFRRRVLQECALIPFGATRTYKDMAIAAGSPTAFRAAGGALGSNPIPIVVPCHRVLASSGGLGGYTGGLERKRLLLSIEGGRLPV
jgi:methylated-DNA-[protein]-cysteine S-methyltransferase